MAANVQENGKEEYILESPGNKSQISNQSSIKK